MLSLHAEMLVFPNATNETALLYEYCSYSRPKLPDILSCQAEARRLALTSLIVRFTDFLMHKSLFTKGFWLAAAEKLYDGATAETAKVVRAVAIQNSIHWKRGVHADGQNRMQCVIEVIARTQWSAHTRNPLTRMTSWYKPDLTYGIQ